MAKPIDSISNRIKKGLSERNMQAVDVCHITGISKGSMSQYINGVVKPKQDRIYLIAKALNVNEAWLLGYDVSMDRKHPFSLENAQMVKKIREDTALSEALKLYFSYSDKKRQKVIEFIYFLNE